MAGTRQAVRLIVAILLLCAAAAAQQYVISTFAGGAPVPTPIPAISTGLTETYGVVADQAGNVYFSMQQCCVYKIDTKGTLTLFAGNGKQGYSGDGGPALGATLNSPVGLAISSAGDVYIAEQGNGNGRIRKVSPDGTISTVAGGASYTSPPGDGGPAVNAYLNSVGGMAIGPDGSLYITSAASVIRKVGPEGTISTIAGTGAVGFGGDGGLAVNAQLTYPSGITVDRSGTVYFVDGGNNRLRRISPSGIIDTIAGNGTSGFSGDGGPAAQASLNIGPVVGAGIASDAASNIFFADYWNGRIREINTAGIISTVAGTGGGFTTGGELNPAGQPGGVAVDAKGNLYWIDGFNEAVRRMSGKVITTLAGYGTRGGLYPGDGGPAINAPLNWPSTVRIAPDGSVYIADTSNNRVRKVTPNGLISTIAGNGIEADSGDKGPAASAGVSLPLAIAPDGSGNLYVLESYGASVIRLISPSGTISTVPKDSVDEILGIAVDRSGSLYFSNLNSCTVRKLLSSGANSVVAGTGTCGFSGDGGPATIAQLGRPLGLIFDSQNNLYVADGLANRIRKVNPQGIITSVLGNNGELNYPEDVAIDSSGSLYVANHYRNNILKLSADGTVTTIAGGNGFGSTGDGGLATDASMAPDGIAVDSAGNVYFADILANSVRVLKPLVIQQQTMSFNTPAQASGSSTIALSAAASSGLPPTFTSNTPDVCTVSAATVTVLSAGTCSITASQTGNAIYTPASPVTQTFSVQGKKPQTITFDAISNRPINISTLPLSVTTTSGLPAALASVTPSVCSVSGATLLLLQPGICSVTASQTGDSIYAAARSVTNTFLVLAAQGATYAYQGTRFTSVLAPFTTSDLVTGYVALSSTLAANLNTLDISSLVQSYAFTDGGVNTITSAAGDNAHLVVSTDSQGKISAWDLALSYGNVPSNIAIFSCSGIAARCPNGPGDESYIDNGPINGSNSTAGTWVSSLLSTQTIAFGVLRPLLVSTLPFTLSATASSGLAVTFSSSTPTVCTVTGTTVTLLGTGVCSITAMQAGNVSYTAAPSVSQSFAVTTAARSAAVVNAVVESAGYAAKISPGGMASIFGANLTAGTATAGTLPLPLTLNGTSVTMNNIPSALFYVAAGQINFQVPWELQGAASATLVVTTAGASSAPVTVPLSSAAPGIFTTNGHQGVVLIANTATWVAPVDSISGQTARPATAGEFLTIYCSGLGGLSAAAPADGGTGEGQPASSPVTVSVGGVNVPANFAGLAPGYVGLYQVNVQIPAELGANSAMPLTVSTHGQTSNTVTIAVQ